MNAPALVVVAVERERAAILEHVAPDEAVVVAGGVGRVNAAIALMEHAEAVADAHAVVSAGVAGALPAGTDTLAIGDVVVATASVYAEEGLVTPEGFGDMTELGFPLGDWTGNAVPPHDAWLARVRRVLPAATFAPIATVATCSGTDAAAAEVARRTGAVAEAMEGAAVLHAARHLGLPALEVRAISNTTGDRDRQQWDLDAGLAALGPAVAAVLRALSGSDDPPGATSPPTARDR